MSLFDKESVRDIAQWARAQDPAKVSPTAVRQCKLLILDTIGCALAALEEHEAAHAVAAIGEMGGAAQSSVVGSKAKTSAVNAVLANGILVRQLDLNDFTVGEGPKGPVIGGHPSDNIPVGLAVGEWKGNSGRDVINAIVLGYELYHRLKDMYDRKKPWDGTSLSSIVAASMTGRLMGLNEDQFAQALALAVMRAPTPRLVRSGKISAAKFLANALVAQSSVTACVLAANGMTGPLAILDEPTEGMRSIFLEDIDWKDLVAPVQGEHAIVKSNVKAFPCLATGQGAAAAGIKMHELVKGKLGDIGSIDVIMLDHPFIKGQQDDPDRANPNSREAADHSFYFIPVTAMIDGELTPRQFRDNRWFDPQVMGLMKKTSMKSDPTWAKRAPNGYPCSLRVKMKDGTEHFTEVDYPPGYSKAGSGLVQQEIEDKFDSVTKTAIDDKKRKAIKAAVANLENEKSIGGLMDLTRG
jgi:2-methylcitrate dehydratase